MLKIINHNDLRDFYRSLPKAMKIEIQKILSDKFRRSVSSIHLSFIKCKFDRVERYIIHKALKDNREIAPFYELYRDKTEEIPEDASIPLAI